MRPAQELHLARLKDQFAQRLDAKYRAGQEEHGGNLYEYEPLSLLDNAIAEVIDLWAYLQSLRDQMVGVTPKSEAYCYDWVNGRPIPVLVSTFCHVRGARTGGNCGHEHGSDDNPRCCREAE